MADKSLFPFDVEHLDAFTAKAKEARAATDDMLGDLKTFAKRISEAKEALKSLGSATPNTVMRRLSIILSVACTLASSYAFAATAFECEDAARVSRSFNLTINTENAWISKFQADVAAGTFVKSPENIALVIKHDNDLIAALDNFLISARFLRNQNCYPTMNAQLDDDIAKYQSAVTDLKDERTQLQALLPQQNK